VASAIALTAALGGCATITRGTTAEFTVQSKPPGAQVRTSTGFTCAATPCTFKMPRKEAFDITIEKAGFQPAVAHVKSVMAGNGAAGFLGNALVGGVIGAGVDISSGAMMDLSPNPLSVELQPVAVAIAPTPSPTPASAPTDTSTAAPAPAPAPAASVAEATPAPGAAK